MQLTQKPENAITEGVIWKQLLVFFFPILLGSLFQQLYNIVDTAVVGRFVSTQALAAVGSSSSMIRLLIGFFIGLSSGATVVLSQYFGAQDQKRIRGSVHTGIALALVGGVIATAAGIGLSAPVLRLIDTPESCLADAILYAQVYFTGSIPSLLYNMGAGLLRAMGDSKRPMIYLAVSCVVNIVLDILLVVVFPLGIVGAAAATVLAQVVSAILTIATLLRLPADGKLEIQKIRFEPRLLRRILQIGFPAGMQSVMFDISNLIIQAGINSFGDVVMAAWTALAKADALVWMIASAFGVAITTFVGQNFGARKLDRIKKSVRICMAMCMGTTIFFSAVMILFRTSILSIFSSDELVILEGAKIIMYIAVFYALYMPLEIFSGAMRGTGYAFVPMVVTCVCTCVFRVSWVMFIAQKWHTVVVLTLAYPISWALATAVITVIYFRGRWLKPR